MEVIDLSIHRISSNFSKQLFERMRVSSIESESLDTFTLNAIIEESEDLENIILEIASILLLEKSTLVLAFLLIERVLTKNSKIILQKDNVLLLVFTSICIAYKYLEDKCISNKALSNLVYLSPLELMEMELTFLASINFNLNTVEADFQLCQSMLEDKLL